MFSITVDGGWGKWSNFTECDANNNKNRTRMCNSPASKWGGLDCLVSGTNDTYDTKEMEIVKCQVVCPSTYSRGFTYVMNLALPHSLADRHPLMSISK